MRKIDLKSTSQTVVDACCLVNICAAGDLKRLMPPMGLTWHVPGLVFDETLFVRNMDDAGQVSRVPIDLGAVVDAGLIHECTVSDEAETASYVEFARHMSDAEAMCLAIAKHRQWLLATDDRKAQRLAASEGVEVITTPELVKKWADAAKPTTDELKVVLRNIRLRAYFVPRAGSTLHAWWNQYDR